MPRKPNKHETTEILIRPSTEIASYLDNLAAIGIHGKTRAEVAKTLVGSGIERLIREGILRLRQKAGK
jgi:phage replication-related protein YjqB (UPF0714/DUF867 family)